MAVGRTCSLPIELGMEIISGQALAMRNKDFVGKRASIETLLGDELKNSLLP